MLSALQQLEAEPKLAKSKCNPTSSSALRPLQAGTTSVSFGDLHMLCGAELKLFPGIACTVGLALLFILAACRGIKAKSGGVGMLQLPEMQQGGDRT